jgi:hypothetical protein
VTGIPPLAADALEAPEPRAQRIAAAVAAAFGPACAALLHYGSHAQRSDARPESAYDFFVIVDAYKSAYRALAASRGLSRSPAFAARLNAILPPNVIAIAIPELTPPAPAKCAVLSQADFALAVSERARDHFTQGRLFQHVQLAFARDSASKDAVLAALATCRERTFAWGRPSLPAEFDADAFLRALLTTSYAAEIRPEGADRIDALTGAQRVALAPVYAALLQQLESGNLVRKSGPVYRLAEPVSPRERARWARYFRRSKRRATLRWMKYVLLYDDWLDYVVQKVERRSGTRIELSDRERRWPIIFLWPRVMRYLRSRPQRRS